MKRKIKQLLIIFVSLLLFLSQVSFSANIELIENEYFQLTKGEKAYIKELNEKGVIKIATNINPTIYNPVSDGVIEGFHYNLLNEFAKMVGVKIEPKLVGWNTYFAKEGKSIERAKKEKYYSYTPDIFDEVDLLVDGITILPWREKLMDILEVVPTKQMVLYRKGLKLREVEDLDGKRVAMVKNSSMEYNLKKIIEQKHINFEFIYTDSFDEMENIVLRNEADFTVYDSDRAYVSVYTNNDLTIGFPISSLEVMGWGIRKDNTMLKSLLKKYLKYAQETEIADKYWKYSYGITFKEYLLILDY